MPTDSESVTKALATINQTWLEGRPQDMEALIHPEITFVFPGFVGRATGRDAFIAGFVDFCQSARIVSYHEHDYQVDLIADMAVASFGFEMIYGGRDPASVRAAGIFGSLPGRPGDGWPAGGQCSISTRSRPRPEPSQRGHGRGKSKAGSHFAGKRPPAGRIAIVMVTRARLSVRPEPLPAASGTAACRAGVPLQWRFVSYD